MFLNRNGIARDKYELGMESGKGLQSLRGIAAILVLIHHSVRTVAGANGAEYFGQYIINPHGAVVVFFVLSGYVLTFSLMRSGFNRLAVSRFYVKRLFRIYPALWAGVALSLVYFFISFYFQRDQFASWAANLPNPESFRTGTVAESFLGLSSYLLPVTWTIKVELAASLFMPFIFIAFLRTNMFFGALVLVFFLIMSFLSEKVVLIYMVQFALGSFVAINFHAIYRSVFGAWLFILAIPCLFYFRLLHPWDYHAPLPGFIEACAAAVLIMGISSGSFRWLQAKWLSTLGDWSYGIYLLHMPIAFFLTFSASWMLDRGLEPDVAAVLIAMATAAVTFPLAGLLYRWIESPAIAAGGRLAKRWR